MPARTKRHLPRPKEGTFKSFDGTSISYRIAGRGAKTILCFNGIGVARWAWLPFEEYFADRFKIITWDYRGHGLSGRPKKATEASFNHLVEDALHLIRKLRTGKAYLIGHSSGLHVALEVLRNKPGLARGIISCLGTPGKALESFMDSFIGQLVFDVGYILNAVLPETSHWINKNMLGNPVTYQIGAALKLVDPAIEGKKGVEKYLEHFARMDFALFNHLMASESKQSAEDVFAKIKAPTLLIASEFDRFVPLEIVKKMHQKIKGSELFIIKNGTHAALFEQPDVFNLRIEKFLVPGTCG